MTFPINTPRLEATSPHQDLPSLVVFPLSHFQELKGSILHRSILEVIFSSFYLFFLFFFFYLFLFISSLHCSGDRHSLVAKDPQLACCLTDLTPSQVRPRAPVDPYIHLQVYLFPPMIHMFPLSIRVGSLAVMHLFFRGCHSLFLWPFKYIRIGPFLIPLILML